MCPAEQADPVRSVEMRSREAVLVIEFQGAGLGAPPAALVAERAAATVALEDLALDRVGNVTRTRRCVRVFVRGLSRFPTRGESLLLHLLDEQVECPLEDHRQISVRDAVAEQILGLAELVMTRATRGELGLEGLLGERSNQGPAFIAPQRRGGWRCERENSGRLGLRDRYGGAERESTREETVGQAA